MFAFGHAVGSVLDPTLLGADLVSFLIPTAINELGRPVFQPATGGKDLDHRAGSIGIGRVATAGCGPGNWHHTEAEAPAELTALLDERQAARKAKDFKRADAIRDELKAKGWVIEDTPKGARLKKL